MIRYCLSRMKTTQVACSLAWIDSNIIPIIKKQALSLTPITPDKSKKCRLKLNLETICLKTMYLMLLLCNKAREYLLLKKKQKCLLLCMANSASVLDPFRRPRPPRCGQSPWGSASRCSCYANAIFVGDGHFSIRHA
jgi:hypothetical protein